MTYEEAARILDPETSREALLPYAYDPQYQQMLLRDACRLAANLLRGVKTDEVKGMTTIEFLEKQLEKECRKLRSAERQGTDPGGIANLRKKVGYFASAVKMLRERSDPCSSCAYDPPSSGDGKPCSICPAVPKQEKEDV